MNPMDLKRGIDLAVPRSSRTSSSAKPSSRRKIAQVGTISANGDTEVGDMIAEAMAEGRQ